nr:ribonuclease H-like domain-containing protein [Tanacetum cinerariifolium]
MLLAILDQYQLRFHTIKDAKSLWAAIKSLDKAYDRFQKLISLLEVHGTTISNEDANQKFLQALPSSWNNIALIMRNKEGIDELDIDDLYNNLKVFEDDIKDYNSSGKASSSSYTDNLMFSFFANKTGLGYGDQLSESNSEVLPSVFDSRSSDGDDNPTNDRFKKDYGYHAVLPPLTGNYMPPLADLSFTRLDDSVYRTKANKAIASISKGEPSVIKTSNISVELPKVDSVRTNGLIIED